MVVASQIFMALVPQSRAAAVLDSRRVEFEGISRQVIKEPNTGRRCDQDADLTPSKPTSGTETNR
jgi:hypothetical protein